LDQIEQPAKPHQSLEVRNQPSFAIIKNARYLLAQ
jgi:hypothetical protein